MILRYLCPPCGFVSGSFPPNELILFRALCFPVSNVVFFASGTSWNVPNVALFIEVGNFGMVTGIQWKQQFELKSGMFGQGYV